MRDGLVVEQSPADDFFRGPRHPYSRALLAAAPRLRRGGAEVPTSLPTPPDEDPQ
jgi:ABC-type dipeptide/oligopeptide/nickel transport system ATPase component